MLGLHGRPFRVAHSSFRAWSSHRPTRHRIRRVPYVGVTRAQVRAVREGIDAALHARDGETRRTIQPEDFYRHQVYDTVGYS